MKTFQVATLGTLALAALTLAQGRGGGSRPAPPEQAPRAEPGDTPEPKPPTRGGSTGTSEDLAPLYFKTSDYDENGWISFAEARASMNLDRSAFHVFDADNDGRIALDEFVFRYKAITARGGAFTPPVGKIDTHRIPKRTAEELIIAFDLDGDRRLDQYDVQRALKEYGAQGVDAAQVLAAVDQDLSGRIELEEAQALLDVLVPPSTTVTEHKYASIEALFDRPLERRVERDTTPQPRRIVGPVSTFRRLDFDASGTISVDDLEVLQRPLLIPVRIGAVVATLDIDGDGVLSPAEFKAALR